MSDTRLLAILDFWHKLEFFIPYDLDSRSQQNSGRKSLWRSGGDPSPVVGYDEPPKGMRVSGYTVFLGIFDKADVRGVMDGSGPATENDAFEEGERAKPEGRTCMASLDLCADGMPLFATFKVSTLPWAVGRIHSSGLQTLSGSAFQEARLKLQDLLANYAARRADAAGGNAANSVPAHLLPHEIDRLVDLLAGWSGYRPKDCHPSALLEIRFGKKRPSQESSGTAGPARGEEEDDNEDHQDIGILNSFFISDLERAMESVSEGNVPATLRQYLTPLSPEGRLDLFSPGGRKAIVDLLEPALINRGRWFADPDHAMSLMQQFAINAATSRLAQEGLFSVNGPPGTGKTTLLRDIIAENITRRARVLAGLTRPADAFLPGKKGGIARLIPELTGYEMVVASSNNTAVENISNDLPKRGSVWSGEPIAYLQPIAHKLAAQGEDGRCRALSESDMPWGLIAAALGKSTNRYRFSSRLFGMKVEPEGKKTWSGAIPPQTFWQWRDEMAAKPDGLPSFQEAKVSFLDADRKVANLIRDLSAFETLRRAMDGQTEERWCAAARSEEIIARRAMEAAEVASRSIEGEIDDARSRMQHLSEEERLLGKVRPPWWERLFRTAAARGHTVRIRQNSEAQMALLAMLQQITDRAGKTMAPACEAAKAAHEQACTELARVSAEWTINLSKLAQQHARFADICPPEDSEDLDTDPVQISGLWHRPEFALLRSDLFRKALCLQEAWLASVCASRGGFGSNVFAISRLLENKPVGNAAQTLAVWQSLFMIVPVISSTFASFARQFDGLGSGALGWVFIDEAGQAVPQAAVGALLRARRAVVIGDPLQIEPIFTLPRRLIADLAAQSPHTADSGWSPDRASVQTLADACNPLGAEATGQDEEKIWIGSPLRVHRRCLDPMFDIANDIAYDGKMVFGLNERLPQRESGPFYAPSCWIDLPGQVSGKQTVPAQVDFVARLVVESFAHSGKLPALYVISPFREVKQSLVTRLTDGKLWAEVGCSKPAARLLRDWLSEQIGTVHTFQGKEEDTVIMLLGADGDTASAARWAASKPNLLNVALTRARKRFYMVGDRQLWGQLRYFHEAADHLPNVSPHDFLDAIQATRNPQ